MRQSEGDSITENLKDRIEMQKKKKNLPMNPDYLSTVATRTAQKA